MRTYIYYLLATILIGHLCIALLLSYRYWVVGDISDVDLSLSQITKYQEQKIEAMQPGAIDTVFLGDSSLGNAIDAKLFDTLAGTHSLNLALTGSHGHAGALVLLRKLLAREPGLHNVILFFAVDGMGFGLNKDGRFYMSASPIEPALSPTEQLSLFGHYLVKLTEGREAYAYIKKLVEGQGTIEIPAAYYQDDYNVVRAQVSREDASVKNYHLPDIDSAKNTKYLREIGRLCKQHRLRCVYVQGPIMAELLQDNAKEKHYFESTIAAIQAAGLTLINDRPFVLTDQNRGDSIFHLAHDHREEFTTLYAKKIMPYLDRSAP